MEEALRSLPTRALARFADFLLHALPPEALSRTADALGRLWYALSAARRRVVQENLRIAFGEAGDVRARARLARRSCGALGRVMAEAATADRILRRPSALRYAGDWEAFDRDVARGRGGLIVTGHLGNWELGAWAVRARGAPLDVMARRLDNPALEALITQRRGGSGQVIGKVGGLRDLVRRIRQGAWVAMLADQNAGRHGIFVPFFGLAASTFPTPAILAVRMDVPLYVGACIRRPCGRGFDVHLDRLEPPGAGMPRSRRVRALLTDVTRCLESRIREAPDQYNWAHRRWKTRPPDGRPDPGRPFYAREPVQRGRHALPMDAIGAPVAPAGWGGEARKD